MHVFDNGFMLANLGSPNVIQILETEWFLFDYESYHFLEFFNVLRLMKRILQNNLEKELVGNSEYNYNDVKMIKS